MDSIQSTNVIILIVMYYIITGENLLWLSSCLIQLLYEVTGVLLLTENSDKVSGWTANIVNFLLGRSCNDHIYRQQASAKK